MPSAAVRALTLLLVGCCCAQEWRAIDSPGGIAAYDQARGEFLSLGGNGELWSSNDLGCWQRPAPVPPAGWIMVHDPLRARTVAMTAINGSMLQTWEWDGARWCIRTSVHTPAAFSPCVVYDPQRQAVLMFCANQNANYRVETWSWDGVDWQLLSLSGPSGGDLLIGNFRMAYDTTRSHALLAVTRIVASVQTSEFWEWDGVQWSQVTFAGGPTWCADMAYDPIRQRTVLIDYVSGTWEYDASAATWQQRSTVGYGHGGMVFARHRGRLVVGSGEWRQEWDGTNWSPTSPPTVGRGPRLTLDPHSGRAFSFGTNHSTGNGTAEHDGFTWRQLLPATSPSPRSGHCLWNDGQDVFLFGGRDASGALSAETWRWNGTDWSLLATALSPSPREGMAITWNSTQQHAFAFGGTTANGLNGETWEFDGVIWLQRNPTTAPPVRSYAAIAHDPIAGRTVLMHGRAPGGYLHVDAWQWNGQQWSTFPTVATFSYYGNRSLAQALTFDPAIGRLLFVNTGIPSINVFECAGTTWVARSHPANVTASGDVQVFPDARGNLLLWASSLLFRRTTTPSSVATFGSSCVRDLVVGARTYPTLGAACAIETAGAPANSLVALMASTTTWSLPLGSGCVQLVPHTQWLFFLLTDPAGLASLPLPVPADLALRGLQWNFQAVTLHPSAPGFALSAGLRLTIGD